MALDIKSWLTRAPQQFQLLQPIGGVFASWFQPGGKAVDRPVLAAVAVLGTINKARSMMVKS